MNKSDTSQEKAMLLLERVLQASRVATMVCLKFLLFFFLFFFSYNASNETNG